MAGLQKPKMTNGDTVTVIVSSLFMFFWVSCHQKPAYNNEDVMLKGLKQFAAFEFQSAYTNFSIARTLAHVDGDKEKEIQALKKMGQCAFWVGNVDTCIYRFTEALVLIRELGNTKEEYEAYMALKKAFTVKMDMKNVMLMTQKIDSLGEKSTGGLKIEIMLEQAKETIHKNARLAEHYLLESERLLLSMGEDGRDSAAIAVYGILSSFYFDNRQFEKARNYSRQYVKATKEAFGQQAMAYVPYDMVAYLSACQKDRMSAYAALDSMKYSLTLKDGKLPYYVMHYHDINGRVHALFGEWEYAAKQYKEALRVAEKTPMTNSSDYSCILKYLGDALCYIHQYTEARKYYEKYVAYCKRLWGELEYSNSLAVLAAFEGKYGDIKIGKNYYVKSVDINMKQVRDQLRYVSVHDRETFWLYFAPKMWWMAAYALKLGESQDEFTEKCYEALLYSKTLLLEADRSMATAINTACNTNEQRMYYEMVNLQGQLKELMNEYGKNQERIEALYKRITILDKQLAPIIGRLDFTSFLDLTYKDVKKSLEHDEALLDFTDFMAEDSLHHHAVFVIENGQEFPLLMDCFTEEDMTKALGDNLAEQIYEQPLANKLLNFVWQPFASKLKGKKTVYYVPSGVMHQIALESIPTADGTLLGEHFCFVRLTSAREITKIKRRTQNVSNRKAMLYGALNYDMDSELMAKEALQYKIGPLISLYRGDPIRGSGRWSELRATEEEINAISEILKKHQMEVISRTGTKGTEESFLAMSGNAPQILHIATHGFYYTAEEAHKVEFLKGYQDAMLLTGLILSGGNAEWTGRKIPKGVMGGVLTANDIANLDLRGTEMVVLSACQTGRGMPTPEGLFGLQRAFKKAGVQTIVMSLWSISDNVTKEFMVKFYEELPKRANAGDKRKAFEAARSYIRNKSRYKNPYYWAGFVILD